MKYCLIVLLLISTGAISQVSWRFSSKKIADQLFEVRLTAIINEPWHIYSQRSPKQGPLPTSIVFNKNPLMILEGETKEMGELKIYYEKIFKTDVYSYADSVSFVQSIKIKNNSITNISGIIEYMACTKERCLTPQKQEFTIRVNDHSSQQNP